MSSEKDFVIENGVLEEYTGEGGDVVIPDGVTEIGEGAFEGCGGSLTAITIPASVTRIGESAFAGCTELKSVVIPGSVTGIDRWAFEGCSGLTNVTIPDGLSEIGEKAFCETGLTSVAIPASVTKIVAGAFAYCSSVKEYCVSADNPRYVGNGPMLFDVAEKSIFAAGNVVGDVVLPDGITKIADMAFSGCKGLTSITIPEGVTEIEDGAFVWCTQLSSVSIPKSMTAIGDWAFMYCEKLPYLVCPGGKVEESGETGVPVLTDLVTPPPQLPKKCQKPAALYFIRQYTAGEEMPEQRRQNYLDYFQRTRKRWIEPAMDDPALLKLLLAEKMVDAKLFPDALSMAQERNKTEIVAMLLEYQSDASFQTEKKKEEGREEARTQRFFETGKLTVSELKKIWDYKKREDGGLAITKYKGAEAEVVIPDEIGKGRVTEISGGAFCNCANLTGVTIPASVTEIGSPAFERCHGIKNFCVDPANPAYRGDGIVLYSKTGALLSAPGAEGDFAIPEGVTEISDSAFYECTKLTGVVIPAGVTKIGASAFGGCTGLTSITIPEGVTEIRHFAFCHCTNLTSIEIPASVTWFDGSVFSRCPNRTIHAPAKSYAAKYAKKNDIPFVAE